jgi:DNA-binding NarL/FixJ family response regulator
MAEVRASDRDLTETHRVEHIWSREVAHSSPTTNDGRHDHSGLSTWKYAQRDWDEPAVRAATSELSYRPAGPPMETSFVGVRTEAAILRHPFVTRESASAFETRGMAESMTATHQHVAYRNHHEQSSERRSRLPDAGFLIVDDCTLHRENLAAVLASHGAGILTVAEDLPTLCFALREMTPEIVLVNMGSRDNVALLRFVRQTCPGAKVIVVGISDEDEPQIISCAEAGVAGYHMRTDSLDDLLVLISRVASGESLCSPRVSGILLRRLSDLASQRQPVPKELVLTAREAQILRMLEVGMSNRDIAAQLCIAVHTVKNHVHSLLSKLGVSTRAQAAALSRTIR